MKLDVFTTFGEMAHAAVTKAIPECHGVEIRLWLEIACRQTQPSLFAATSMDSTPSVSSSFILEVDI